MTKTEYREYIDSLSYSAPEWLKIRAWNNKQVGLLRKGLREPRPNERLVDVYYDEVKLKGGIR